MKNLVMQTGRNITVAAPYALVSGGGALVGSLFGVASTDAANGATVVLDTGGVYRLAKTAGQAFVQGGKVYWDNAAKTVTANAAAGANPLIGVAIKAAAGGDATADVRLGFVA